MTNLKDRIESAKKSRNEHMNCHGTALYLVGQQKTDQSIDFEDALEIFGKMRRTKRLNVGNLITWEWATGYKAPYPQRHLSHTAVVTGVNPILVTHRDNYNGPLIENVTIEEVERKYGVWKGKIYEPIP